MNSSPIVYKMDMFIACRGNRRRSRGVSNRNFSRNNSSKNGNCRSNSDCNSSSSSSNKALAVPTAEMHRAVPIRTVVLRNPRDLVLSFHRIDDGEEGEEEEDWRRRRKNAI